MARPWTTTERKNGGPGVSSNESKDPRVRPWYEGDSVEVFDPEHQEAHPLTDWKPATVIEMCDDGDVAVRYNEGEEIDGEIEEEVSPDECRLVRRGPKGRAAILLSRRAQN